MVPARADWFRHSFASQPTGGTRGRRLAGTNLKPRELPDCPNCAAEWEGALPERGWVGQLFALQHSDVEKR